MIGVWITVLRPFSWNAIAFDLFLKFYTTCTPVFCILGMMVEQFFTYFPLILPRFSFIVYLLPLRAQKGFPAHTRRANSGCRCAGLSFQRVLGSCVCCLIQSLGILKHPRVED